MSARNMRFKSLVILTGAGISAESGIRTFRASDQTFHEHRLGTAGIEVPKLVAELI
jgi:NAD-dependent SIR2 family protein deacetylase